MFFLLNIYIAWQFCVGGQKHSFFHVMMIWKEKIEMVSIHNDLLDLSFQKTIYDNLKLLTPKLAPMMVVIIYIQ
jgi:hypothetical protein